MRLDDQAASAAGMVVMPELEEIVGRYRPAARSNLGDDAPAGEDEQHRHLGGGVGVAEAADDGAAIADRYVSDMRHGFANDRVGPYAASLSSSSRWRVIALTTILSGSTRSARQPRRRAGCRRGGDGAREPEIYCRDQALTASENDGTPDRAERRANPVEPSLGALYSKSAGFIRFAPASFRSLSCNLRRRGRQSVLWILLDVAGPSVAAARPPPLLPNPSASSAQSLSK